MAIISNLLRLIAKPIFLKLGKGLKSSKTQYCLGDELDIRLDESITGKDNVIAKPPTHINSFARWVDGDAKQITDSKTVQDDNGNTTTSSDQVGYLSHTLKNTRTKDFSDSVYEAIVEDTGGNPIFRWIRNSKQIWTAYSEKSDNSFRISGVNQEDPTKKGDFLKINTSGNVTTPFQWSAFAILSANTGLINHATEYLLGQGEPLTVIDNVGGYFYPGEGNNREKPASFTILEAGKYLVYISAVVSIARRLAAEPEARILVEGSGLRTTGCISIVPQEFAKNTVTVLGGVKGLPGDVIKFSILTRAQGSQWEIEKTLGLTYTTFVGVYCLG